ncbi:MAG: hypothetical protein J7L42_05105 [Elusimicrobia bacterium]|nr:hypothetical protein [Elusimicrobiota bacterium]
MKIKNKFLFPEYDVNSLDFKRDKFVITQRILENGNLRQIKGLIKIYGLKWIKKFIKSSGIKKLSIRSLNFWLTLLDIKDKDKILKEKLKNQFWNF